MNEFKKDNKINTCNIFEQDISNKDINVSDQIQFKPNYSELFDNIESKKENFRNKYSENDQYKYNNLFKKIKEVFHPNSILLNQILKMKNLDLKKAFIQKVNLAQKNDHKKLMISLIK